MKTFLFIFFFGLGTMLIGQTISTEALDPLLGEKWTGTLMYLDYSSNEEVKISVELEVTKVKDGSYKFAYTYPDEPQANSTSKVKIAAAGNKLGGNKIIEVKELNDEGTRVVTESKGEDNNDVAKFHLTYSISKGSFTTKKEVKYKGSDTWFVRNQYTFSR